MKEMLEEHDLHYESDVNVCRYVDGEKEILNKEAEISLKEFNELMDKEKATFQVHQPQRFNVRLIDTYLLINYLLNLIFFKRRCW